LNDSCEFEEGEELENPNELVMSITSEVEHHNQDESNGHYLQESCEEEDEPTNLEFNNDILSIEYDSFSHGFEINKSLDEGFYVEYESFSFDPIVTDILFEPHKSKFVESEIFVPMAFGLDRTLTYIEIEGLVDLAVTVLRRPFVHYDVVSRPMPHLLANFKYVCMFGVWA